MAARPFRGGAVEHDGHLFVTFSRNKAATEVIRVRVADVELFRLVRGAGVPLH